MIDPMTGQLAMLKLDCPSSEGFDLSDSSKGIASVDFSEIRMQITKENTIIFQLGISVTVCVNR